MSILKRVEKEMKESLAHLQEDLKSLRTGRANPSLLEGVRIEVYGSSMPLRDLASISSPEARQLLVTPFDASNVAAIVKGIDKANLGFQAINDANIVRVEVPVPDQRLRQELAKRCREKGEAAKISIRQIRQNANKEAKKQKSDGDLPEDQCKSIEKGVQEKTDRFCKEVDLLCKKKEEEIISI